MQDMTFAMIKPDAVAAGQAGAILAMTEKAGFRVKAIKLIKMTQEQAQGFYAVHKERPFFNSLVTFMTEGPTIVMALQKQGEDAVKGWRDLMGATNPANAAEGTIRKQFAQSIERNCVHGSDAPETAETELTFFFSQSELL